MTSVDPVILPPIAPTGDPLSNVSLRAEIEHIKLILFQNRERTGGDSDSISDIIGTESYETSVSSGEYHALSEENSALDREIYIPEPIEQEEPEYSPVIEWRPVETSINYTAVDHDFVEATKGAIITLDNSASFGDQIEVGNGDGTNIKVTSTKQIKYAGRSSTTLEIKRDGTFIKFYRMNDHWRAG